MIRIEDNEAKRVEGGINILVVSLVTTAVIFVSGIISGIVNPTRCNNS